MKLSGGDAAKENLPRALKYRAELLAAADRFDVSPGLLAAVVSRETNWQSRWMLPPAQGGELGDNGFGHGPGQIDKRSHPAWCAAWRRSKLTVQDALHRAAEELGDKVEQARRTSSKELPAPFLAELIRRGVAAYNCSIERVMEALREGRDIDAYTTGRDYSADVMARAEVFRAALGG